MGEGRTHWWGLTNQLCDAVNRCTMQYTVVLYVAMSKDKNQLGKSQFFVVIIIFYKNRFLLLWEGPGLCCYEIQYIYIVYSISKPNWAELNFTALRLGVFYSHYSHPTHSAIAQKHVFFYHFTILDAPKLISTVIFGCFCLIKKGVFFNIFQCTVYTQPTQV